MQNENRMHEDVERVLLSEEQQKELYKEAKKMHTFVREGKKIGRNDPCPCGSGKKYKHCCGKNK